MRTLPALFCAVFVTALAPSVASAKIYEIGATAPAAVSSCPTNCTALARLTAYQIRVGDTKSIDVVHHNGELVAWTVSLGKPDKTGLSYFVDSLMLGATPEARITVLHPLSKGRQHAVHQGPLVDLTPYLGKTVQFTLPAPIPVKKGWIVALTVPTWAPVLADHLAGNMAWRASRPHVLKKGKLDKTICNPPSSVAPPQDAISTGQVVQFWCVYPTERLDYSATEISTAGTPTVTTPTTTQVPPPGSTTTTTTTPTTPTTTTPTKTTPTKTTAPTKTTRAFIARRRGF
jgi:hypothetical protein